MASSPVTVDLDDALDKLPAVVASLRRTPGARQVAEVLRLRKALVARLRRYQRNADRAKLSSTRNRWLTSIRHETPGLALLDDLQAGAVD